MIKCKHNMQSSKKNLNKKLRRQKQQQLKWQLNKSRCNKLCNNNNNKCNQKEWPLNKGYNKPNSRKECNPLNFNQCKLKWIVKRLNRNKKLCKWRLN